jgi:hypothetical protein
VFRWARRTRCFMLSARIEPLAEGPREDLR